MTRVATAPMLLACFALSACNTTDALVPLVDIGEPSRSIRSSPVTQGDAERMAGAAPRQQAFASEQRSNGYHPAYNQTGYRQGSGAPPTTMEAQAMALENDTPSPAAAAPIKAETLPEPVSNARAEEEDMVETPPREPPRQQTQTAMLNTDPPRRAARPSASCRSSARRSRPSRRFRASSGPRPARTGLRSRARTTAPVPTF